MTQEPGLATTPPSLSKIGCALVLVTAFLGWMCAGWQLAISSLAMRDAAKDLLGSGNEGDVGAWFGRLICAFLLGAAFGGYVFGFAGDRLGRAKAMGLSILWYSGFSAATVFVTDPWQLLACRFLGCMGIGGMWPNGIALVSEAWPNISRPFLAGAIGTAANFGIMILSAVASWKTVTAEDWRWIMWFGSTPFILGLFVLFAVPESPKWLALQDGEEEDSQAKRAGIGEIFKRPLIATTILGIALGTVPLFGGWGSSTWVMPWAAAQEDMPELKAHLSLARSLTGTISSLLGGGIAMLLGRRRSYFIASLGALVSAQVLFWFLTPEANQGWFIFWFGMLGFFSGFFFGWLPLFLPELFPTRVRSTGAGVSFNWGRIVTALGVVASSYLLQHVFGGDYAQIGRVTSLVYVAGMIVILFAPDTSNRSLAE
ncbi:MAG: MFS transporter [Planctomycetes bacterium]|nr:MFS transporter [Planctomycetota bacterium]